MVYFVKSKFLMAATNQFKTGPTCSDNEHIIVVVVFLIIFLPISGRSQNSPLGVTVISSLHRPPTRKSFCFLPHRSETRLILKADGCVHTHILTSDKHLGVFNAVG